MRFIFANNAIPTLTFSVSPCLRASVMKWISRLRRLMYLHG
jgi:hypothetical protein